MSDLARQVDPKSLSALTQVLTLTLTQVVRHLTPNLLPQAPTPPQPALTLTLTLTLTLNLTLTLTLTRP